MAYNQTIRSGLITVDTSRNDANTGPLIPPTPTTLASPITVTTSPLAISLVSGAATVNGTYLNIDTGVLLETVLIQMGGGTNTPTVLRAQLGTTAITHTGGATVVIPGSRQVNLLPAALVPNVTIEVQKVSPVPPAAQNSDINFVQVVFASGDYGPAGILSVLLIDNGVNSLTQIKFPGFGHALGITGGVGSSSAGQVGPVGPPGTATPPAPNILGATVNVFYAAVSANSYGPQNVSVSGLMTLDVSNPNFSHEKLINVYAVNPAQGINTLLCTIPSSAFGGSTAPYSGIIESQPTTDQTGWSLTFVAVNESGNPTAGPYTSSTFTILAPGLTSMAFTEVGPRVNTNGTVSSTFSLVPVVRNAQIPIWITAAVDYQDGNGPQFIVGTVGTTTGIGQFYLTSGGEAILWNHWVPTNAGQTSWVAYAVTGNIAQNVPLSSVTGVITQGLTVTAVGAPLATDLTNAQFVPDGAGNAIQYVTNSVGVPTWYYTVQVTLPQLGQDINFWFGRITAQQGFAQTGTGTVSGGNTLADSSNPFLVFAAPLGIFDNPIVSGGTGYVVGDLIWLVGGTFTSKACYQVMAVSGGAVTKLAISYPGTYTAIPTAGTTATTTNSVNGTGLTVTVNAVGTITNSGIAWNTQATSGYLGIGSDIHIGGVLTTVTGYTDAGHITFASVAGISNGAGQAYEIWNPAPNYQGLNAPGLSPAWQGTSIFDTSQVNQTGIIWGSTVQYVRDATQGWGMPPVHNADGSNFLFGTWRWRAYAGSYLMSNPFGGTLVLQTSCWVQSAIQDHEDVTPANVSNPLDLTQSNLNSVEPVFTINPVTGKFDVAPAGVSTVYIGQAAVAAGQTNLAAINAASGLLAALAAVTNLQQTTYYSLSAIPAIASAGSGYVVGDQPALTGGTYSTQAVVQIVKVSSGGVPTAIVVIQPGAYSVEPSNPVSTSGGTGTGLTLTATWSGGPTLAVNNGVNVFTAPMYLSQGSNNPSIALLNSGIFLYGANAATGLPIGLTTEPYMAIQSTGLLAVGALSGGLQPATWVSGSGLFLYTNVPTSGGNPNPGGTSTSPFVAITAGAGVLLQGATIASGTYAGYAFQTSLSASELLMTFSNGSTTITSMMLNSSGQVFNGPVFGGGGTYAAYWPQVLLSASGLTIQTTNGSLLGPSSLILAAASFALTNGTLTCTLNSTTTTIDNAAWGAYSAAGLTTVSGSGSTQLGAMVSPGYLGAFYGNLPSSPTAFSLAFVLFNGVVWTGGMQVQDTSGNQGYLYPKILELGGAQVVTTRQSGPGNPSGTFSSLAAANTWCTNLYIALSASGGGHGLIS